MPCLLAIFAVLFPRLVMILIAICTNWFKAAFDSAVWPLLGFLFMPYTTLAYMAAMLNNHHNVNGGWLVLVVIAVLIDLGGQGGIGAGAAEIEGAMIGLNRFRVVYILMPILLATYAPSHALADVKPSALFGDHMVLQQGMAVPVWGWADPGEQVTVSIGDQKQTTTAGANGKWMISLGNLEAGGPLEMTIAGKNSVTIHDVLIGEVWIGSGQSNMEFSISKSVKKFAGVINEEKEIAAANYPKIRMFTVKVALTDQPLEDVVGHWAICMPENVPAFSAVGYFFSRDLQKSINLPIGFINTSSGGSVAQAWISKEDLQADPRFKSLLDNLSIEMTAYKYAIANRTKALAQSATEATTEATAAPATESSARQIAKRLVNPINNHNPYMLWNGMIHPVEPYAMRGVVWYQGESIVGGAEMYSQLMQTLITTWRTQWGEGDFPFYFVQLAALDNDSNKPQTREAQALALKIPNTAMAVTIDIGDKKNVHPKNKQDVGDRLARIARALVYHEKIEYSGPMYDSMEVQGDSIRIKFTHIGSGLEARNSDLKTFEIAGADKKFVPATTKIDGDSIVVTSADVKTPLAVRYAWSRWPEGCNLYNADGLPAAPFRTDAW